MKGEVMQEDEVHYKDRLIEIKKGLLQLRKIVS
jgi:hypothetical protein